MVWKVTGTHLISYIPKSLKKSGKIASFDLDGTLINTKSGLKFARSPQDWKFFQTKQQLESLVIGKLKSLVDEGYLIVIFTNQGGVSLGQPNSKSFMNFKSRLDDFIATVSKTIPDFNPVVFASPKRPGGKVKKSSDELHLIMRKPQIGMWSTLVKLIGDINMDESFFVGDAAGRTGDFSDSDAKFAENIHIKFLTPEEFFI